MYDLFQLDHFDHAIDIKPAKVAITPCITTDHYNQTDYRYNDKKDKVISGNKQIITYPKNKNWTPKVGL